MLYKKEIANGFPGLIARIKKSEDNTVNLKFHSKYQLTHQTGQKLPIHLQPKVKIEIEKLLN